jgi:hypothetical protein
MAGTNNQFVLRLPEGWEDQTAYTFMGPEINGQRQMLNLVVDCNLADTDLREFALDRIQPLRDSLAGIETLKEEERLLANGIAAYEWVFKWVQSAGQVIFKKHLYMIINKRGYTFTSTFTKQSFKTIGVEVDRMIESFTPES